MSTVTINYTGPKASITLDGKIDVDTIAWYIWNGFTVADIQFLVPETPETHILFACYIKATTSNFVWRRRWLGWAQTHGPSIMAGVANIPLPPNEVIYLKNPLDVICEIAGFIANR